MTQPRRKDQILKKNQTSVRETRDEISEEIKPGTTKPRQEHPNRDRARGDWDRTGDHHDEGTSRAE
jgi:hypothetical protein